MKTLEEFINEQPDERPVDFNEPRARQEDCGCVLIHYGREVLGLRGTLLAGVYGVRIYNEIEVSETISVPDKLFSNRAVAAGINKPETYGELRALLKP